jgi:hypothetical protein
MTTTDVHGQRGPDEQGRVASATSRDRVRRVRRGTAVRPRRCSGPLGSAAGNIPGVDFASISVRHADDSLQTVAATDQLAYTLDELQYELHEGPCYATVTDDRLMLANDLWVAGEFPRYATAACDLGVGSQLAIRLLHDGEQAGLNVYAHRRQAFDRSTIELAELFATAAAEALRYAEQVEQLGEALHSRTDIGTAIGIVMERYDIGRSEAFSFLVRTSNQRNVKIRALAGELIAGTFTSTREADDTSHEEP